MKGLGEKLAWGHTKQLYDMPNGPLCIEKDLSENYQVLDQHLLGLNQVDLLDEKYPEVKHRTRYEHGIVLGSTTAMELLSFNDAGASEAKIKNIFTCERGNGSIDGSGFSSQERTGRGMYIDRVRMQGYGFVGEFGPTADGGKPPDVIVRMAMVLDLHPNGVLPTATQIWHGGDALNGRNHEFLERFLVLHDCRRLLKRDVRLAYNTFGDAELLIVSTPTFYDQEKSFIYEWELVLPTPIRTLFKEGIGDGSGDDDKVIENSLTMWAGLAMEFGVPPGTLVATDLNVRTEIWWRG